MLIGPKWASVNACMEPPSVIFRTDQTFLQIKILSNILSFIPEILDLSYSSSTYIILAP